MTPRRLKVEAKVEVSAMETTFMEYLEDGDVLEVNPNVVSRMSLTLDEPEPDDDQA